MPFDFSPDSKKAIQTLAAVVAKQPMAEDAKADLFGAKKKSAHWGDFQKQLCFRLFDAGKVTYPMIKGEGVYKGRNENNVVRKLRTLGCFGEHWSDPRDKNAQDNFSRNVRAAYEQHWKPTPFSPGWYLAQGQEPPNTKPAGSLGSPPPGQGNTAAFTTPALKGRSGSKSVEDGNGSPLSPVSSNGGDIYRETTSDLEEDLEKAIAEHEETEEDCAVEMMYLKEHDDVVSQLARSELILKQSLMESAASMKMNAEASLKMASNFESLVQCKTTDNILEESKSQCNRKIGTEKKRLHSARKVKDTKKKVEKSREADIERLVQAIEWDKPVPVAAPQRGYIGRGLSYIGLGGGSGKPEAPIEEDNSPVVPAIAEENGAVATPSPAKGKSAVNTPATKGRKEKSSPVFDVARRVTRSTNSSG